MPMFTYRLRYYLLFTVRNHANRLLAVPVFGLLLMALAWQAGMPKEAVHWGDVAGEGLSCALALTWLLLLLCARPDGGVTRLLFAGALCYWGFTCLDLMDEFIRYPADSRLFQNLESFSAPLAMMLLTAGLFSWLKEQRMINRQLQGREGYLREHRLIDPLTHLYNARYFHQQLALMTQRKQHGPLFMALVTVHQLRQANYQQGVDAGDKILCQFSESIAAQLTGEDLLCRLAGNQFALLICGQPWPRAKSLSKQLLDNACHHSGASITLVSACNLPDQSPVDLFERLHRQRHPQSSEQIRQCVG